MRLPWAAAGRAGQGTGQRVGDRTAGSAGQRAGQGRAGLISHPSRQLPAAFALRSQWVAVDHHPLDLELGKEKRWC